MAHTKYETAYMLDDEFCNDTEFVVHLQYRHGAGSVVFDNFQDMLRFRDILVKGGVNCTFVEEQCCKVFTDEYLDEESMHYGI